LEVYFKPSLISIVIYRGVQFAPINNKFDSSISRVLSQNINNSSLALTLLKNAISDEKVMGQLFSQVYIEKNIRSAVQVDVQ